MQKIPSPTSSSPPPAALAQDGTSADRPASPAFSTGSTADGGSSPVLPPLPTPTINGRVVEIPSTPPRAQYYTASWGSPYPDPSEASFRSELSDSSPLRLDLRTRYLRPAPSTLSDAVSGEPSSASGLSAAVLLKRVRQPTRGLTEDWIRQHTGGDSETERANWLSDSSEHSSVSCSEAKTPRQARHRRGSSETVKPENMASPSLERPLPALPPEALQLPETKPTPPPRFKKVLPFKGKKLTILLPHDDERGKRGKAPMPMAPEEVERMFKDWEQLGYSTRGFDLSTGEDSGQSRRLWPDADELLEERATQNYQVVMPDLNAWKAYVDDLAEAKLRALGVSFGDDEPSVSPAPSAPSAPPLSRQTSMQYPQLPFSPPLPTSSATSSHVAQNNLSFSPFMPPANLSTGQSSNVASVGSPASMQVHLQGKLQHPAETRYGSPFQFPQNGMWSPQVLQDTRGASPMSLFSPDGYFQQPEHGLQPMPFAPSVPSAGEKSPSKTPEARPSMNDESLQQEIEEAEYHLEKQMEREVDNDYSPDSDKHGPVLHHPQPHSRGHSLSQRAYEEQHPDLFNADQALEELGIAQASRAEDDAQAYDAPNMYDDLELGEPGPTRRRGMSEVSNPWAEFTPSGSQQGTKKGHAKKPSFSKLNVAAKDFNPSNSFSSFVSDGSFEPGTFTAGSSSTFPTSLENSYPSQPVNFGQFGASSFSFGNPISAAKSDFQSEFNFSSPTGPTFRPDAPAFTPFKSTLSDSVGSGSEDFAKSTTSIFGNIDMASIIKPPKKSKAIPIVRPDSAQDKAVEGADGRITQSEGRIKRARASGGADFAPALFAERPLTETNREQSPPKESTPVLDKVDKENAGVVKSPTEQQQWLPYEFESEKHVDSFNAAVSYPVHSGTGVFELERPDSGTDVSQRSEGFKKHRKTLSATAKPFEFNPQTSAFSFGATSLPTTVAPTPSATSPAPVSEPVQVNTDSELADTTEPVDSVPVFTSTEELPEPVAEVEHDAKIEEAPQDVPALSIEDSTPVRAKTPKETARKSLGLSASMFASSPPQTPRVSSPEPVVEETPMKPPSPEIEEFEPLDDMVKESVVTHDRLPTPKVEEMPARALSEEREPRLHQPSPSRPTQIPEFSSPYHLQNQPRSENPSPSPQRFAALPQRLFSQDPFVDQPAISSPIHRLNSADGPASEWDDMISEGDEAKLPRSNFFDNHVGELVGGLLAQRLGPLEKMLELIQYQLRNGEPQKLRGRRSLSGELPESDADDEDEDEVREIPRRSLSPRKDRKLEKIRAIVNEVISARPQSSHDTSIAQKLDELKEQFGTSMRLDFRGDDLRNIVEDAVERRMPQSPKGVDQHIHGELENRLAELQSRLDRAEAQAQTELDNRRAAEAQVEIEITNRRAAEAQLETELHNRRALEAQVEIEINNRRAAEAQIDTEVNHRKAAEAQVEIEIGNRRLAEAHAETEISNRRAAEAQVEAELNNRRAAEDRLSEVQRLLRISSEEEDRLRETLDDKIQKLKQAEETRAKTMMKVALLEAGQENATKSQVDVANRLNLLETELRQTRADASRWQLEAERNLESAKRHNDDAEQANETNHELRRMIDKLKFQMEESNRVREDMRGKFNTLQENMSHAAREIAEETARRTKREQELIARQEVLDARLQAEAKTRERFQQEIERLEKGEREGMRAVSDCKRLEALVAELRDENHDLHKSAMRFKREFEEARESGLAEVERTKTYLTMEVEAANNQVNIVREELENRLESRTTSLRAELDQVRLDADTAKARSEMLIEEAFESKEKTLEDMARRHKNEIEDLQTTHDRKISSIIEDTQRSEQLLLERLQLSSSKTEHLQDKVTHLEEKLEIAQSAAAAAAKAARSASVSSGAAPPTIGRLPEKISPQALRESIMVLQEQLQDREQKIEQMEQQLAKVDLDAPNQIAKRDDEITWLRELLAVRIGDLEDIINTLSAESYDPEAVRDAAIRLKANLDMEQQERERYAKGVLPNITATLKDATPRVAQAVGPLAAAWGNWRKARESSPQPEDTPSKGFLSGLMTPPTASRPQSSSRLQPQPTAFGSTGRRFTPQQLANRPRGPMTPKRAGKMPERDLETPPMMRKSSYDMDAQAGDFSDAGFYDDDSTADENLFGTNFSR